MTKIIYETHATGHWKELFESKNKMLGAHNLAENEEICATIKHVGVEEIYDQQSKSKKKVPALIFEGNIPPMTLNITNSDTIGMLYTPHYPNWVGKKILIYSIRGKFFGKDGEALRVRNKIPRDDVDLSQYENSLRSCQTMQDLQKAFLSMPKHVQGALAKVKDQMKESINANS